MFPIRKRLRSRSVTPVGDDRDSRGSPGPNRLPSADWALELVWKAPEREIDGPSPPRSRADVVGPVRCRPCLTEISQVPRDLMRLRRDIVHEPMYTSGRSNRKRCMICYRQKKTKLIHSRCVQCDIYLCFEDCWRIWHSAAELPGEDLIERPRPKRRD